MKLPRIFFSLTVLLFFTTISFAQNIETIFSKGYNTHVGDLERLDDNSWVLAYITSQIPGSIYKDTVVARIIDSAALLLHEIVIPPLRNFENLRIEKVFVLPGNEFIICYSGGDCDAGGAGYFIQKFDSLYQPLWHIELMEYFRPQRFAIGLDDNILLIDGSQVAKMLSSDGSIIWQIEYSGSYAHDAIVEPGTENIIMSDNSGLKYFVQKIIQGEIKYTLEASNDLTITMGSLGGLMAGENGIFYVRKYAAREILRFRNDLEYEKVLSHNQKLRFVSTTPGGLVVVNERGSESYEIILYDTAGLKKDQYISPESGLRPAMIRSDNNGIGLAGTYDSGPPAEYDSTHLYGGRSQGWFRYFPGNSFADSSAEMSIAISEIIQHDSIIYDTYWSFDGPFQGYLHNFHGGDFKLKFTNTGAEPVHSFWANIVFGYAVNVWFCGPLVAKQVFIDKVTIYPGESMWYEFGDIDAYRQMNIPGKFCFWTSGPNNLPDYNPLDDMHCMDRIVSTKSITESPLSIYPNPANSVITLSWDSKISANLNWNLIDVHGRVLKTGITKNNSALETIDVSNLSAGIYYFISNHSSGAVVIDR